MPNQPFDIFHSFLFIEGKCHKGLFSFIYCFLFIIKKKKTLSVKVTLPTDRPWVFKGLITTVIQKAKDVAWDLKQCPCPL